MSLSSSSSSSTVVATPVPTVAATRTATSKVVQRTLNLLPYPVNIRLFRKKSVNKDALGANTLGASTLGASTLGEVKSTDETDLEELPGGITFFSSTDKFGEPKVDNNPELSFIVGATVCPVISLNPVSVITGMKVEWKDIDANIICSEDVANLLCHGYADKFTHTIYVPDFATVHYEPNSNVPHFFTRLIQWSK